MIQGQIYDLIDRIIVLQNNQIERHNDIQERINTIQEHIETKQAIIDSLSNTTSLLPDSSLVQITISPVDGISVPGCHETLEGCYTPNPIIVPIGSTVVYLNTGTTANIFAAGSIDNGLSGEFDSFLILPGSSFEWTPTEIGEVNFFSYVHPWAHGIINVTESDIDVDVFSTMIRINTLNTVIETKLDIIIEEQNNLIELVEFRTNLRAHLLNMTSP